MNTYIKIRIDKKFIYDYIDDFKKGNLQVPGFQRDFVWKNKQITDFFDSIEKGYPTGSLLLWKPEKNDNIKSSLSKTNFGPFKIPEKNENSFYVVDGFQRLTTIFGCLINPSNKNLSPNEQSILNKNFSVYYNLEKTEGEVHFEFHRSTNIAIHLIPLYNLIDGKSFFEFQKKLFEAQLSELKIKEYLLKYETISKTLQGYEIPSTNIFNGTITQAVDIFQRLNSKGQDISPDWIVSALSFNQDTDFQLSSEIQLLLNDLKLYNFHNLDRKVIFNTIANSFGEVYFDKNTKGKKLEQLAKRDDFPIIAKESLTSIFKAVQFLRNRLNVFDEKDIPYDSQLINIADFFRQVEKPNEESLKKLERWFWVTSYSNYFTLYNLSKQRLAYKNFQAFIKAPKKNDPLHLESKFETKEFPEKINRGSVRSKVLLLFMIKHQIENNNSINNVEESLYGEVKIFEDEDKTTANTLILFSKEAIDLRKYIGLKTDRYERKRKEFPGKYRREDVRYWRKIEVVEWLGKQKNESYHHFLGSEILFHSVNPFKGEEKHLHLNLIERKKLIIKLEKKFVENLGIKYIEPHPTTMV